MKSEQKKKKGVKSQVVHCNKGEQIKVEVRQDDQNKQEISNNKNMVLDVLKQLNKNNTKSQSKETCSTKNHEQQQIYLQQIPQPIFSSQQWSRQLQYLSYFVQLILDKDNNSQSFNNYHNKRQKLKGTLRQQFLQILYQCVIYIKKQNKRTETDDQLLIQRFNQHLQPSITPKSKDLIGNALLANGYCICAYSILWARINHSNSVLVYLFNYFNQKINEIEQNSYQYSFYAKQDLKYFDIPIIQIDKQQIKQQQQYKIKCEKLIEDESQKIVKRGSRKKSEKKINKQIKIQQYNQKQNSYGNQNENKQSIGTLLFPKSILKYTKNKSQIL